MIDRDDALRDLLAEELGDSWQPGSFPRMNLLSYQERQQLKNGPDTDFVTEKLSEAQRGRKRTAAIAWTSTIGGCLLLALFPASLVRGDWAFFAGLIFGLVPLGVTTFGFLRHMRWRKREMIYRAFHLLENAPEPAARASARASRLA